MAWIESHQELREHPKTKRLCRLLALPRPMVVGYLHFLWWWAYDYAADGDLSAFTDEDIADALDWEGDPGALVSALIHSGFVTEDRRLHDWEDFAQKWIERRQADRERKRARRQPSEVRETSTGCPVEIHSLSGVTGPDHTGPNRTGPKQQPPTSVVAAASAPRAATAAAQGGDGLAVPDALAGFHETLSGCEGYAPTAAFLAQVAAAYSSLDLAEEALKMADWLRDQRGQKRRQATQRFVLGWLKRELDRRPASERTTGQPEPEDGGAVESLAPPTDADAALWDGARSDLAEQMSRPNWETYIAPLDVAGRAADGGLRLRAPPGLGDALRRFRSVIVRSLDDAGDPGATRVAIVEARPGQE